MNFLKKLDLPKFCAIIFIIGVFVLFFLVAVIEPEKTSISDIDQADVGKLVTINAFVKNKILRNGNMFLDITEDNQSYIKAIMFENNINSEVYKVEQGSYINVIGRVDRYIGEMEIIITKIKVVY